MGDLSNKELLIPYGTYQDMVNRANKYKKDKGVSPDIVYLDTKNKNDYVVYARLKDMESRVKKYNEVNNKFPDNVWIKPPNYTDDPLKPPKEDVFYPTVNIKGKKYNLKSFTEFYNLMGGFGYSYYYNDIYTLSQEIANLTQGKAMNCTDFAQLGVYIASQFIKNGKKVYTTRYRHVDCKSGGGHSQFEIRGGEFKYWTVVDLAARADRNSKVYPIGTGWCSDGRLRGYNESWILSDDGKT